MIDENAFDLPETFEEEDIDIFAELGVAGGRPINNATDQQQQQNGPNIMVKSLHASAAAAAWLFQDRSWILQDLSWIFQERS